jgi:hypothetical protein
MGQMKDKMIDSMNVHEIQEYLINHRSNQDAGYIKFLEQHLEEAEKKINILTTKLGPGKCVECFKKLPKNEIICAKCQDECDGRWDHLKKDNNKKESQE